VNDALVVREVVDPRDPAFKPVPAWLRERIG